MTSVKAVSICKTSLSTGNTHIVCDALALGLSMSEAIQYAHLRAKVLNNGQQYSRYWVKIEYYD